MIHEMRLNREKNAAHPSIDRALFMHKDVDRGASEPFRGLHADDLFSFQRSLGIDRWRPGGIRTSVDRSGFDENAFQHPLLLRSSPSGANCSTIWSSTGNTSRNSGTLSIGSADVVGFYMFDSDLSSEHATANMSGNNMIDFASPSFMDFSF
ncbi:hypothetical protein KSP39_PZI022315 [Platanthera zijinensis]|uniref:Uncharacterized protein n=1 Tax=Platanthera zijinensis TaxID=2320716 RepID=A0AAP0FV99_9ASPA